MRGIPKSLMTAAAVGALFALSACGSTETSRTATGAGSGAVAGAVVGGPVGAVVGGVGGAVAGNSMDEGLGKKTDRWTDKASKEVSDARSDNTTHTGKSHRTSGGMTAAGMSHERVRDLQQALNDHNDGRDITVDGIWGASTRRALIKFQRDNGLKATGRADDRTLSALNLNDHTGTSSGSSTGNAGDRSTTGRSSGTSRDTTMPNDTMRNDGTGTQGTTTGQPGTQAQ
ncbi:peptidoglycan-binding domain-containing protein [Azospirillum sp. TSO35-2]|uniref:peptidoglycan-binding domain-containing protein n=1 Tax=Azospirillum sp. TSO35-2 TaxID=716796 RepID=UPI000D6154BE|nr:peptidoglycan-binding domain-containing protein [Azospirillum sp. TSO35-2]PWC34328.1 hypothetical protein TSO352_29065 [Azospirillum sp. TSO35-2]